MTGAPGRPGEPEEHGDAATEETYAEVFDCGALEVSCHITQWFHGLVVGVLDPLLGWVAGKLFATPGPTAGVTAVWEGVSATANALYLLLVLAAGFVLMAHHSVQAQYGAREVLPRLVVGFVASNASLNVVGLAAEASTAVARAVGDDGIDAGAAARHLSSRSTPFLADETSAVVLFLLVLVVLLVLWVVVEIVRVVIVVLLMVGGPLMLMFHGLPQTNRVAQMWWRTLAAVCLVPVAQAIAFVALTRVFFEGDTRALFGVVHIVRGEADLFDLFLLLVLVYVQIRIPVWAYRAVWSPPAGRSPAADAARSLASTAVLVAVTAATGGGGALAAAARSTGGRTGALLRAVERRPRAEAGVPALPRRVRTWRFGTPDSGSSPGSASSAPHRPTAAPAARSAPGPAHAPPRGGGGPAGAAAHRRPRNAPAPPPAGPPDGRGGTPRPVPRRPGTPPATGTGASATRPEPPRDRGAEPRRGRTPPDPGARPARPRAAPAHRRPVPPRHRPRRET
ncbi:hypothetical protein [Nocardiopsis tropica]|uniref:TrbL/VirB6 plasmid conjugal transfer protein n=1 Tax=Nocardiopsis tropica TaxID=109330 RepID=A0ABU7KKL2_9ACTN|nr:hypothetical protein [Nocardiopsis umidischolae]MEE2049813.1 hypothetical protein [Nocardiopsis umidischolae]